MPNLSFNRVNQKLAHTHALLTCMDELPLTTIHLNSLKEASAFHLMAAYQHYLYEIAETYQLKNIANIRTEEDLVAAFATAKKFPVGVEELLAKRTDQNSWLAQLHIYYQSLLSPSLVAVGVTDKSQVDHGLIEVLNLEQYFDLSCVDTTLLRSWYTNFVALILHQRETNAEF